MMKKKSPMKTETDVSMTSDYKSQNSGLYGKSDTKSDMFALNK